MEVQNEIRGSVWPTQARLSTLFSLKIERGESYVSTWYNSTSISPVVVQQHFNQPCCVSLMQTFILTSFVTRIHLSQLP